MSHSAGPTSRDWWSMIDAYVDGGLDAPVRREFEAAMQSDTALAAEVALQRRADDSIRRQFAPPPPAMVSAPSSSPSTAAVAGTIRPARRSSLRPLLAAAVLALVGVVGYWTLNGSPFGPAAPAQTPQVVYQRVVSMGFKPEWVCADEAEFAKYTREQFGTSWVVKPEQGLTLVGWRSGSDLLGPDASLLLAEHCGKRIVVAVDRSENDRRIRAEGDLHVFRKLTGGLVMYEISPFDRARVIERVEVR